MNPPKLPHAYTEGDELPEIVGVWESTDITTYTITLRMERPGDLVPVALVASPLDPVQGKFSFKFGPTDLVPGLDQPAQIEFKNAGGQTLTSCVWLIDVNERFD